MYCTGRCLSSVVLLRGEMQWSTWGQRYISNKWNFSSSWSTKFGFSETSHFKSHMIYTLIFNNFSLMLNLKCLFVLLYVTDEASWTRTISNPTNQKLTQISANIKIHQKWNPNCPFNNVLIFKSHSLHTKYSGKRKPIFGHHYFSEYYKNINR